MSEPKNKPNLYAATLAIVGDAPRWVFDSSEVEHMQALIEAGETVSLEPLRLALEPIERALALQPELYLQTSATSLIRTVRLANLGDLDALQRLALAWYRFIADASSVFLYEGLDAYKTRQRTIARKPRKQPGNITRALCWRLEQGEPRPTTAPIEHTITPELIRAFKTYFHDVYDQNRGWQKWVCETLAITRYELQNILKNHG